MHNGLPKNSKIKQNLLGIEINPDYVKIAENNIKSSKETKIHDKYFVSVYLGYIRTIRSKDYAEMLENNNLFQLPDKKNKKQLWSIDPKIINSFSYTMKQPFSRRIMIITYCIVRIRKNLRKIFLLILKIMEFIILFLIIDFSVFGKIFGYPIRISRKVF